MAPSLEPSSPESRDTSGDLVRRVDEDRWLASRFAPPAARAKLIAIYALDYELSRIRSLVREPAAGALRLAWWRDAIADAHAGRSVPPQPTLEVYAAECAALDGAPWQDVLAARTQDFEPVGALDGFERYAVASVGGVMTLALEACGGEIDAALPGPASVAWAYVAALRTGRLLPKEDVLARARSAYEAARASSANAPAQAFPAYGFIALAPIYLRALSRGRADLALLRRQLRLVAASATGRL
jgi:phytoene synthase